MRVGHGKVVAVVGPNGAGKSTLLKAVLGVARMHAGRVELNGSDVTGLPLEKLARLGVGYVPQLDDVFEGLRVRENLDMGAYLANRSQKAERLERVLELFPQLRPRMNRFVETLSGGERKMTAIARVLMLDPSVLILDEPTAGLDPKQIIETRQLIRSLAGDHTIILSTHILSEIEHSCDKVIIISHGKLVATDTVANLTNRLRGSEAVALEIDAGLPEAEVRTSLEQVPGVSRVMYKESRDGRHIFEVESLQGRSIRPDLARAVVNAGWNLNELRAVGLSLETIFLQLTASESKSAPQMAAATPEPGGSH
jgi:ABC-2 type transport system ATP-binding protein